MRRTVLLCLAILVQGCTSWDTVRDEVMTPVNEMVHRHYKRLLIASDEPAIAALYRGVDYQLTDDTGLPSGGAVSPVERAECVIERATDTDDDRLVLRVWFSVRGKRDDQPVAVHRRMTMTVARADVDGPDPLGFQHWRIVGRELISTDVDTIGAAPAYAARELPFRHRSRGVDDGRGGTADYTPGSGLAAHDADGDGDCDLLLVAGDELALLLNDGKGQFTRDDRGIAAPAEGECRFAVFGDSDNDGDADLFVGVLGGPDLYYRNDGERFTLLTPEQSGLTGEGHATGAVWLDVDGDGDLDLYVGNGHNLLAAEPSPVYAAKNGHANRLYRNKGDGTFTDVTDDAGVGDTGWALAVTAADVDDDGDVDLFVANDFGPDVLYRNDGDGTFTDVSEASGIVHMGSSMGAAFGDVDGDGDLDILVTAMASNSRWMLDLPAFPAPAPWPIRSLFRGRVLAMMAEMFHGNRLYLNQGTDDDGVPTFEEVSHAREVHNAGWAWGGLFGDLDNDGDLDAYVLDGLVSGEDSTDC